MSVQTLPRSLMGSALASGGSVVEPAGIGFFRHGDCFTGATSVALPTNKTLPGKPNTSNVFQT